MKEEIIIEKGIMRKPKKSPDQCKRGFNLLKKGDAMWHETTPQNLLTSFKAWCSRTSRDWKAQSWTEEKNGKKGAYIKRIK